MVGGSISTLTVVLPWCQPGPQNTLNSKERNVLDSFKR